MVAGKIPAFPGHWRCTHYLGLGGSSLGGLAKRRDGGGTNANTDSNADTNADGSSEIAVATATGTNNTREDSGGELSCHYLAAGNRQGRDHPAITAAIPHNADTGGRLARSEVPARYRREGRE